MTQSCSSGYFWNGATCSRINSGNSGSSIIISITSGSANSYPVCVKGNYFHPPSGMCLRGSASMSSQSCNRNQIWNGVGCSDLGQSNTCSAGYYYDGSSCRSVNCSLVNICVGNQYWNGRSCQAVSSSASQGCSSGYYYKPYKCCLGNF